MTNRLRRPVCALLECDYPLVLAGMGGVARAELVAAVCEAGGFGFLGMVREPPDRIRDEVRRVREKTSRRFGVNLIPAATDAAVLDAQIDTCIELGVEVICLFWDVSPALVQRLRQAGMLVVCQVGSVQEARDAEAAGAQVLIAQGREAGGHVRGDQALASLLPEVVAATSVPVLAAGGIADGLDVVSVMSLGAQGAVLGTALMATDESFAHDYHKQRLVQGKASQTRLTDIFHVNWPRGARVRVLANSVTDGLRGDPFGEARTVIGEEEGRPIYLFSTDSPLRSMTGDFEAMALYAGQGVERIDAIVPAGEKIAHIVSQAEKLLSAGIAQTPHTGQFSSPACFAHEIDEAYMGYADRDELLASFNELLEAERAGARVTYHTAAEIDDANLKKLVEHVHKDEIRWCGVLTDAIESLGGTPSRRTGDFFQKTMAIADLNERLAFLNRGQAWVVRKLRPLLPRIGDEAIRNELSVMLSSHEDNIGSVEVRLGGEAKPDPGAAKSGPAGGAG